MLRWPNCANNYTSAMPSFTCPNIAIPLSVRQMPPYTCPNVRQRQLEIADPRFGVGQAASMQAARQAVFWHCQYSHTALMLCCRQAMLTISAIAQVEYQLPMPSRPAGSASMLNTTNEHCGQVTHSQIIFPDHFFPDVRRWIPKLDQVHLVCQIQDVIDWNGIDLKTSIEYT